MTSTNPRVPGLEIRHRKDADVGGLRIWWFLRCRLARPISLFRTIAAWVEGEVARGGKQPPAQRWGDPERESALRLAEVCGLAVRFPLGLAKHGGARHFVSQRTICPEGARVALRFKRVK